LVQERKIQMSVKKSAQDYFSEAGSFLHEGKLQEASERLKDGLRIDPTNRSAWMNLGVALKDLGDYEASERCLLQAKELDPNYGNTWFNLGSLYLRQLDRYEDAYNCLKEAIRCNPDDEDAVGFAAEALLKLGRWGEAGKLLDKAIEEHPDWEKAVQGREDIAALFRQYLEDIASGRIGGQS
jgi:tetratricopeptide (TPR) repeat protein